MKPTHAPCPPGCIVRRVHGHLYDDLHCRNCGTLIVRSGEVIDDWHLRCPVCGTMHIATAPQPGQTAPPQGESPYDARPSS